MLSLIKDNFDIIKQEGLAIVNYLKIDDGRSDGWLVAPLKVEEEDKGVFTQEQIDGFRQQAPITTELIEQVQAIASSFSLLKAHSSIKPHSHSNPYITHTLTLQAKDSYIITNGQTLHYTEGEFTSFDYRHIHEVHNNSDIDRIVLLIHRLVCTYILSEA